MRIAHTSWAKFFTTLGTRRSKLIDGGRFSSTRTGISTMRSCSRVGTDHELTGEHVALDVTGFDDRREQRAPESLQAVRVGAAKVEQHV